MILTKKSSLLAKMLLIAILMTSFTTNASAQKSKNKQEKVIKRPSLSNHTETDKFVDSSFDVYERNQKIANKLSDLKANGADPAQMKKDLNAQLKEVVGLLSQSKNVIQTAKNITPKPKAIKAAKSANMAAKALTETKDAIPAQLAAIKDQTGN
ncbi:MAG: hypothetical protein ACPGSL_02245 [Vicingaceae bacterium]